MPESVGRIGFGAMRLTGSRVLGPPKNLENARRVLRRVIEREVPVIDTADAYGPGFNESLIGEEVPPGAATMVATKGGFVRCEDGGWKPNGRPEHLRSSCLQSLRRLRREIIDIYQLHTPDPDVPLAESMGCLGELQREGLIRSIGVSNVDVEQLAEARRVANVEVVQNRLSLWDLSASPVLRICAREGIRFLAYTPLNDAVPDDRMAAVADRIGLPPTQLALAWLLTVADVVTPIPGTRRLDHLELNLDAGDVSLPPDVIAELDRIFGYPR
ncbi:aldo/keto reductase [Nonomuraea sp. NPDC050451]|uniref:aldo/keto reductase n=1 Tax=Nonomuraea sp. NPDC050451 TaxID=3364364 RepID=UPI0037A63CA6